jgi:transcriptional regulator with XRE-family HTH domain
MATAEERACFAKNLKEAMERKGLKQSDLAREVFGKTYVDKRGYEQPYGKDRVSDWLAGKTMPRGPTLDRIAKAVEWPLFELLVDYSSPPPSAASPMASFSYAYRSGALEVVARFSGAVSSDVAGRALEHFNGLQAAVLTGTAPPKS